MTENTNATYSSGMASVCSHFRLAMYVMIAGLESWTRAFGLLMACCLNHFESFLVLGRDK
jgi:purine-cytosine permease-like protein